MIATAIQAALAAPFGAEEIQWRAIAVRGRQALAAPYIDVRSVMRRLDEVLSIDGWQDSYELLPSGCVVCTLRVRIDGLQWIERADVGAPICRRSRSWLRRLWAAVDFDDDDGNAVKSAYSDALKRAAVKFGVGRYLDRVLKVWVEYDPARRELLRIPTTAMAATAP